MTDAAPDILYSVDGSGEPVAYIERREEANQAEVLERFPGLVTGAYTTELARLVNHFARKFQYEVIEDPEAFAEAYRAQIAAEDASENWSQGVQRLRNFGVPDFNAIEVPSFDGKTLVFYARSMRLGVPYEVRAEIDGLSIGEPSYQPMPMAPASD